MALDPDIQALLDSGQIATRELIRIDLPGRDPVGYHMGGRPFTYNGLQYLPNRFLQMGSERGDLGVAVSTREVVFANVPTNDPDDLINTLETFKYTNAPVIITILAGAPESNEVLGILNSSVYEINDVTYDEGEQDDNGDIALTVTLELEPPGRSARGTTAVMRAQQEQQFDNSATDTCLEYASVIQTVPVEWGQRSG